MNTSMRNVRSGAALGAPVFVVATTSPAVAAIISFVADAAKSLVTSMRVAITRVRRWRGSWVWSGEPCRVGSRELSWSASRPPSGEASGAASRKIGRILCGGAGGVRCWVCRRPTSRVGSGVHGRSSCPLADMRRLRDCAIAGETVAAVF